MALLYIDSFKASIDNPYNIKGFYTQFNPLYIKSDVDPKDVEAQLLNEKVVAKVNIDQLISSVLSQANIKKGAPSSAKPPRKTLSSNTLNTPKTLTFTDLNSPFKSTNNQTTSLDVNDTLEAQFEKIEIESLKGKIRTLMKDLLVQDPHYNIECYETMLNMQGLNKNILQRMHSYLESDLASYEGRTLIQDGIVVLAGFAESAFDGNREVFGHKVDLKGLANTLEVSLRKRRTETSAIHTTISETFGFGPASKILFDVVISAASTIQHNNRNTSNMAQAVKANERSK